MDLASKADRHELYIKAVQSAEAEVAFVNDFHYIATGRDALSLREDFCGSGAVACEWVKQSPRHSAIGVDIDAESIQWGLRRNVAALDPDAAARVELIEANVLDVATRPVDAIIASNFSCGFLPRRSQMLDYLKRCRSSLKDGGIMILHTYGGPEAQRPQRDRIQLDGFTYEWEQVGFDPTDNRMLNYIHFEFPDGSRIDRAFEAHLRMWTPVELEELLADAGFSGHHIYAENTDEDGVGNGEFLSVDRLEMQDVWVVYVVGLT